MFVQLLPDLSTLYSGMNDNSFNFFSFIKETFEVATFDVDEIDENNSQLSPIEEKLNPSQPTKSPQSAAQEICVALVFCLI
jgi:hypothetical protein